MNVHQVQRDVQKRGEADRHYRGQHWEMPIAELDNWLQNRTVALSSNQKSLQRHRDQIEKVPETNRWGNTAAEQY